MTAERARPQGLKQFIDHNLSAFRQIDAGFEREYTRFARSLPADYYEGIRSDLIRLFSDGIGSRPQDGAIEPFSVRVVLDTNIVVQDAFAVAKGRQSTTARLLESEFIEVYAPPEIREETNRIIRAKLPRGASLEKALSHAATLLDRIRIVDVQGRKSRERAAELIGSHSPEDVSFLAVAIEVESKAVVSLDDRAFGRQNIARRWILRDLANVVVSHETGSLSLVVVGSGAQVLLPAVERFVVGLVRALTEILEFVASLIAGMAAGAIDALSRVPAWGWILAIALLAGVGIAMSVNEGFRNGVMDVLARVASFLAELGRSVVAAFARVGNAMYDFLVWIWNTILPLSALVVIVAGVLFRHIDDLLRQSAAAIDRRSPSLR